MKKSNPTNSVKDEKAVSTLILGGCRSGKSKFAFEQAMQYSPPRVFVATLETKGDSEMEERVRLHRAERGQGWTTVEEPVRVAQFLEEKEQEANVFLVDCLTMWITNLILKEMTDSEIQMQVHKLSEVVSTMSIPVILVANEVGLGIVPENFLGRRFRDLAGWTNQEIAKICAEVVFVAAGLPMYLKR